MDLGLSNRVVLVTGGSRGIGHAIAKLLVEEGAQVAICARDADASTQAASEMGAGCGGFCADVSDDASVARLIDDVVARFGRLDGVVNNAGRFGGGPTVQLSDQALVEGFDVKATGDLRVVRHALPHLRKSDQARVVNVSGISAEKVTPGAVVTAVANAGVLTLTGYLAHELMADQILVNAIIPGYTLTGVWADRAAALAGAEGLTQAEGEQRILELQAMGHARWGEPDEVAQAVVFFLSAQASFINGTSLRVDGGQFGVVDY
jgi:NAD(P)-dependent dehydrogenase (short-subunit alcohol dehydrogenase family)